MMLTKLIAAAALVLVPAAALAQYAAPHAGADMLIIAHRGASGERPEHTLAAYERAIDQGADYIEPDLVVTKDGVLVSRHENEISGTTDVAERAEFADRRATKTIDGEEITGWFAEDFTLAELRTLRAIERLPDLRPQNTAYNGLYQVPTFAEVIALVKAKEAETGRTIGLYPELKHPAFLLEQGHDTVALVMAQLAEAGYFAATDPVILQSFEVAPLRRLNQLTELRLVQLVHSNHGPPDMPDISAADMVSPTGLAEMAKYADGLGADMRLLLRDDLGTTGVTEAAQDAGLMVHAWTARKENAFLPDPWRDGDDPAAAGCDYLVYYTMAGIGVDGIFTDDPARAVQFMKETDPRCPEETAAIVE